MLFISIYFDLVTLCEKKKKKERLETVPVRELENAQDFIGGTVYWSVFGFNGGGWLRRPVGVHAELLGQVHVAGLWHLPCTA